MKTKIVYILISVQKDIYLEQAWVSIYSLRKYNPNADVVLVCDVPTAERCNKITLFRQQVNTIITNDFDKSVSNKERSRWLKTNLRNLVKGDFLFVDTDTIVTAPLSEIDSFDFDIGMVYDWHCPLSKRPNKESIDSLIRSLFNTEIDITTDYYNSGVIYCKDTQPAHSFFKKWHENWLFVKDKPGGMFDQQSLIVTVNNIGGVHAMPGEYNCQVLASINYLATAKIVHFFNTNWAEYSISPFFEKSLFEEIKKEGKITPKIDELITNCRSSFVSPSMVILNEDINIWRSPLFKLLRKLYNRHPEWYNFLNRISQKKSLIKIIR